MFSYEFSEISKDTPFYKTPPKTASPNRGFLHCAVLKALHSFQEKKEPSSQTICKFFFKMFCIRFSLFSKCLKTTWNST